MLPSQSISARKLSQLAFVNVGLGIAAVAPLFIVVDVAWAKPCRVVWNDYKAWPVGPGSHKAMAATRGVPSPLTCFWWRSDSAEVSSQNALSSCNQWQADTCEIVDVDGVPRRHGLDAFFSRPLSVPVEIDVFDAPSQRHQQMSGELVQQDSESGSNVHARLVTGSKTICEGDYVHEHGSMVFNGTATCFKAYGFSFSITATGYRYIDSLKNYAFEGMFKKEESYIHVVAK